MALALLELANHTGDTAFLDAARAGFSYEDALFDSEAGNWPDFRERPFDTVGAPGFMIAWCNGAPGIALSRLRARDLDPQRHPDHTRYATAALATTLAEVRRRRPLVDWDATYCHGVAGLIDTLWTGGHLLGREDLLESARSATFRLARHSVTELRSGAPGGTANPSLMLGTAGIGYQLLRIAAPGQVPSALLGLWDIPRANGTA
jgi:lantibiotic modifying enzyme